MPLIIGIVGESGSGKETLIRHLSSLAGGRTLFRVTFSDVLKETLELWGISPSRENLSRLAAAMIETYGERALAHAIQKNIEQSAADAVILDGVRWRADAALVRSFPKNLLIAITADPQTRFARLKARNKKPGEEQMTFEQFMTEGSTRSEQDIPGIKETADIRVENNGTDAELQSRAKEIWQTHILPSL